MDAAVHPPARYLMTWGGMYEHLESDRHRLMIVVPATFLLIFLLLFTTFNSVKQAALVFTGIPFAICGGILALVARSMPFFDAHHLFRSPFRTSLNGASGGRPRSFLMFPSLASDRTFSNSR